MGAEVYYARWVLPAQGCFAGLHDAAPDFEAVNGEAFVARLW